MTFESSLLSPRSERYLSIDPEAIVVYDDKNHIIGNLDNVSRSGIGIVSTNGFSKVSSPGKINGISIAINSEARKVPSCRTLDGASSAIDQPIIHCGSASVARVAISTSAQENQQVFVGLAFEDDQTELLKTLAEVVKPYPYVSDELREGSFEDLESNLDAGETSPVAFQSKNSSNLFAKCHEFKNYINDLKKKNIYQRLYRVTATSGLDNRMILFDPIKRVERIFTCFDSNSYLGMHQHPRVLEKVVSVTKKMGAGTPSAQVLCGTNRYLRELELELSSFHKRQETMIFPTGFAANIGVINALIRHEDAIARDHLAHASIHEGCRTSRAKFNKVFRHNDPDSLENLLRIADSRGCHGKLVVTDGVFSMHGRVARLPELLAVSHRYGAKFMIDEAHSTGVLGENGGGTEEYYNMEGAADILMGTLSKTLGGLGGYICGDRDLITYLRYFAGSGVFTTSPPPGMCAGVLEALKIIQEEPEHRLQLWENIRFFSPALREAGFVVSEPVSPIVTVFMGVHPFMWEFSRHLFDAGVKCGNVMFPAVPMEESILRMTLNSRHTKEDLEFTIDTLTNIGRKFGILHKTEQEIKEIGKAWHHSQKQQMSETA